MIVSPPVRVCQLLAVVSVSLLAGCGAADDQHTDAFDEPDAAGAADSPLSADTQLSKDNNSPQADTSKPDSTTAKDAGAAEVQPNQDTGTVVDTGFSDGAPSEASKPGCQDDGDCPPCQRCQSSGTCNKVGSDTFKVAQGGISNHASATTPGSVAWTLACAKDGDTVLLTETTPYRAAATIKVPAGVTLQASKAKGSTLQAASAAVDITLVTLGAGATLRDLVVDGNHVAKHLVIASNVEGVTINHCTLQNTRNDYPEGEHPRCHAVVLSSTSKARVLSTLIQNAGYPKSHATSWGGVCAGIYAHANHDLEVAESTIQNVLTAGLDFTSTIGAKIHGNQILNTGRNRGYCCNNSSNTNSCKGVPSGTPCPVADGITAYHNLNGNTYQEIFVYENTVEGSGNHGIHISGRDVHITNNTIAHPWAHGVFLADTQEPHDCASNGFIQNNSLSGISSAFHKVYVGDNWKEGAIKVSGNGSDVVFKSGANCQ